MKSIILFTLLAVSAVSNAIADDHLLQISPEVKSITVKTEDGPVTIQRERNDMQLIGGVLQPLVPVAGVHPMGELEVIEALNDPAFLVVDMRTTDWRAKSTIPGSAHVPYTEVSLRMDEFGCKGSEGNWDCNEAIKVVAFCNGPACSQSPIAIRAMVRDGFPVDRIYYYRGGMQNWTVLGLTVLEDAF